MTMSNKLEWNGDEVQNALMKSLDEGFTDALEMLRDDIHRKSRFDSENPGTHTRDTYQHTTAIQRNRIIGTIGSPSMNAVWEEFGTGEFAERGDGRKGGWVYYDKIRQQFFFTYGKTPNKPMRRAYSEKIDEMRMIIEKSVSEGMSK